MINIFAIPPIITCILIFIIGVLVYLNNKTANVNKFLTLFCFSMVGWLIGYSGM